MSSAEALVAPQLPLEPQAVAGAPQQLTEEAPKQQVRGAPAPARLLHPAHVPARRACSLIVQHVARRRARGGRPGCPPPPVARVPHCRGRRLSRALQDEEDLKKTTCAAKVVPEDENDVLFSCNICYDVRGRRRRCPPVRPPPPGRRRCAATRMRAPPALPVGPTSSPIHHT